MPKKTHKFSRDIEARRRYRREISAACRGRRAERVKCLQESVNFHRSVFGIPLQDFSKPDKKGKGQSHPVYLPPPEEMARMTKEEISDWRKVERKKRRLLAQRKVKKANDEMESGLMTQLAELEQMLNESLNKDASECADKPAAESSEVLPVVNRSKSDETDLDGSIVLANMTKVTTPAPPVAAARGSKNELNVNVHIGSRGKVDITVTGSEENGTNDAEFAITRPNNRDNEIRTDFSEAIKSLPESEYLDINQDDVSIFSDIVLDDMDDDISVKDVFCNDVDPLPN